MATESDLINLKSREDALYRQINELSEIRDNAQELLDKDLQLIKRLDGQTAATGLTPRGAELLAEAKARVPELQAQIRNAEAELGPLRTEVGNVSSERVLLEKELAAQKPEPTPPATAGEEVKDDAAEGPTKTPPETVDGAPAAAAPADTGTDDPTKTSTQNQAITTDSNSGKPVPAPGTEGANAAAPVIQPGAAAPGDDAASTTPQQAVNAQPVAEPNIKPRPNVLDQYASYSYSASVYLLTEVQYARLINSRTKTIDGYQLLFQSGGAPNNVGGIRKPGSFDDAVPGAVDAGRNPYFDNDFYIDSITIENVPSGKGTGSAHTTSLMKFTVVEPNGMTLLDRLYDAVANSQPKGADGKVNYSAATYLMVMRFYGYDSEGNLEQVRTKPDQEGTSDPSSVVEKFFPFQMRGINWSVGSKLVSYEWECVPVGLLMGGYASRGTIPYDVQLVDSTVGGLLGGDVSYSNASAGSANPGASTTANQSDAETARLNRQAGNSATPNQSDAETARLNRQAGNTPPPPKADAAPSDKKTITRGLAGAMNEFQKKLVKDGVFTYADEYVVKFIGPDANKIRDAKLQLPNAKVEKRLTASGQAPTQDAQALDQRKTSVDMVSRSFSITAGQQLLQAIEMTIRNSSYIYDQAVVIINADGTQSPNPNSRNKPLKWFTISMTAEPISPTLDPKRNDYAYRITYSISSKEVKNVISKYFPPSTFSGVHKSYPYWFTGENTAVLDYQETLNRMYQMTVSGSDNEKSLASKSRETYTSSMADIVTYNYAPTSTESGSGAGGRQNELGANAAEVLYSPSDLRECKIKIVGDPAWIMQGSNFRTPDNAYFNDSIITGFDPDGSISFDTQDVLFEIRWQRPQDYDIDSGLADPYSQTQKKYNNRTALQSRVYMCKKVISEFRHGRFEQTLEGALYLFPIPDKSNTANPAAANKANNSSGSGGGQIDDSVDRAEAAKLARQARGGTGAGAGRGGPGFSETDPRRLDRGNDGKAAVLGAQSNSRPVPAVNTTGQGSVPGGESALPGQLGSGTAALEPTPPAALPTSGNGGTVTSVPAATRTGPPVLPAAGTDPALIRQPLANAPVNSTTNPVTQPIVREA
jgi:hypothetical protein